MGKGLESALKKDGKREVTFDLVIDVLEGCKQFAFVTSTEGLTT